MCSNNHQNITGTFFMQMYSTVLDKRYELLEYNSGYNRAKYVE